MVKNLPAVRETWVQSLGWKDPLEDGMATPSSILAWRIPMDRGGWWALVHAVAESRTRLKRLSVNTEQIRGPGKCVYCLFHRSRANPLFTGSSVLHQSQGESVFGAQRNSM